MSELSNRNVPSMYQISHQPRLYIQLNGPRSSNTGEGVICGRIGGGEPGEPPVTYFKEPFIVNGRESQKGSNGTHLQQAIAHRNANVPKKYGHWISKKANKNPQSSSTSPVVSECESDDSGLSSTTSVSIQNGNSRTVIQNENHKKEQLTNNNTTHRVIHNSQHYQLHIGNVINANPHFTTHQHSLLFHNKRRHPISRSIVTNRGLPAVRCFLPNIHHYNMSIAPDRFLMKSHLIQVKETPSNLLTGSKWDTMSQDVWNEFMKSQQTEEVFKKKMELWRFLYLSIKGMFPRYSLYLVGSTVSGFGSNLSDMDLCLLVKNPDSGDCRFYALQHLNIIYHFIQSKEMLFHAELIQAKVPILKFCDNRFFLEVDLNCNNIVGIRNTHLLYCYSQLDWRVRPLVLIVKLWAHYNNINDAKNKTISSYSLVLMVIHYLQCGVNPPVLPCLHKEFPEKFNPDVSIFNIDIMEEMPKYNSKNNQPLGELLHGFLKYYTNFKYSQHAVSVRTGNIVDIEDCRAAHRNELYQWKLLCVEEPFDLSNTARSVYDSDVFNHILNVFDNSLKAIEKSMRLSSILPSCKQ